VFRGCFPDVRCGGQSRQIGAPRASSTHPPLPFELMRRREEIAGYDEIVLLRDIRFESHCEHHMAPIIGRAHIA